MNGWGKGFLRWVAYVVPILAAVIYLDSRYGSRADVEQIKIHQAAMLEQITDLTAQVERMNGYLAAKDGVPLPTRIRRR